MRLAFLAVLVSAEALKCQQCTETVDHNGNPVGIVDPNCDTLQETFDQYIFPKSGPDYRNIDRYNAI